MKGTHPTVSIRPMQAIDLPQVLEMETLCFTIAWTEAMFKEELQNSQARYLVGCAGDNVVGYAGYWIILDEGHITNIAVHPDARRSGVGKALLQALLLQAQEEGILSLTLEVRKSNASAIALYEGFGFQTAGVRKKYYEDNSEDALIMWATVNQRE